MARYVAFLRAINVGGHVVSMAALKAHFEAIGLCGVETFIASGNVVFESDKPEDRLVAAIERRLRSSLAYEVRTFLRTTAEVAALASYSPFPPERMASAGALVVGLLDAPLTPAQRAVLEELRTAVDEFHVHGREMYWRCAVKQSQSTFSNAVFEKRVGCQTTFRGLNTLVRLAAKYPASAAG